MTKIESWRRDDTEDILSIERFTSSDPLSRKDFLSLVESENVICFVIRENKRVIAFAIYEMYKFHLSLYTLVVHPDYRGKGLGTLLIEELKKRILKSELRRALFLQIRESHLDTLNWAKKRGFLAISVNFEAYFHPEEDGIIMVWKTEKENIQKSGVLEDIRL